MRERAMSLKLSLLYAANASFRALYALILYFRGEREKLANSRIYRLWRRGREAEGGGLLRHSLPLLFERIFAFPLNHLKPPRPTFLKSGVVKSVVKFPLKF
jgi:hypothetical protein